MQIKMGGHGIEFREVDLYIQGYNKEAKTGVVIVEDNTISCDINTHTAFFGEIKMNTYYIGELKFNANRYAVLIKQEKMPIKIEENKESHPSWGIASLIYSTSNRDKLFGSLSDCRQCYNLEIKFAALYKSPNFDDKTFIDKAGLPIVSVVFTREQLLNLLVGTNNTNGTTPCTITFLKDEGPIQYKREDFGSLETAMRRILSKWKDDNKIVKECTDNITRLAKEKPTKENKKEFEEWAYKLNGFINGTMPFEIEQLFETIEKTQQVNRINTESNPPY